MCHTHLEHSEQALPEAVKVLARFVVHCSLEVELAAEHLHAEQSEYHNEQEQQEQKWGDGLYGVQQRSH